jgi:hypothetical protein
MNFERIWAEVIMAHIEALLKLWPGRTAENHEKPQSRYLVAQPASPKHVSK